MWKVGDKIRFVEERRSYTVQAISASGRYLACTKPFAAMARDAVMYSVVDLIGQMRGVDNSIGNSLGYETREQCESAVALFESGEFEFSHRKRPIPLRLRTLGQPPSADAVDPSAADPGTPTTRA